MNDGMLFDRGVRPSSADIIKSLISSCMRTKFVLFVCMVSFVFPLFLSGKCKRGNLQIRVKETFTRDFVHDVSIFDVCYPVYRRTAECLLNGSSYTAHDGWLKDVDNPDDSTFVQTACAVIFSMPAGRSTPYVRPFTGCSPTQPTTKRQRKPAW